MKIPPQKKRHFPSGVDFRLQKYYNNMTYASAYAIFFAFCSKNVNFLL